MNKVNWTMVVVFTVVLVFAFLVGLSLFGGWLYGGWGMMGARGMGPGMMGRWGFSPSGWVGMFGMMFMWLIPLGILALVVLGIVGLFRSVSKGGGGPVTPDRTCPSCGRAIQADWQHCPFCGQTLT
jgi:hypothetical protein